MRGSEIIRKLSDFAQDWTPQSGTVYPLLKKTLLEKGYVSLDEKTYQITQAGELVLEKNLEKLKDTVIFIDNIFNYCRSLLDGVDVLLSEDDWLQNHMPQLDSLIDNLPMTRSQASNEKSPKIYVTLTRMKEILQKTIQSLDKQITAIKDEEKIVRVKIK